MGSHLRDRIGVSCALRIGLWDPFRMGQIMGLEMGVDPNQPHSNWDDPPKWWIRPVCSHFYVPCHLWEDLFG